MREVKATLLLGLRTEQNARTLESMGTLVESSTLTLMN